MSFRWSGRYLLLMSAATVWLAALVLAPYARHHDSIVSPFVYFLFSHVCHQLPERSFSWMGIPLAVCHRCLGLYFGFWLGLVLLPHLSGLARYLLAQPRSVIGFLIPLAVDLLINNTPASRFSTGMIAAFPVAVFVWLAAEQYGDIHERKAK